MLARLRDDGAVDAQLTAQGAQRLAGLGLVAGVAGTVAAAEDKYAAIRARDPNHLILGARDKTYLRSEFHILRSPQFYSLFRRLGV